MGDKKRQTARRKGRPFLILGLSVCSAASMITASKFQPRLWADTEAILETPGRDVTSSVARHVPVVAGEDHAVSRKQAGSDRP